MYRDDLEATHARVEALERALAQAQAGSAGDRQRIADLSAQLAATRHELQRLGGAPSRGFYAFQPRGTTILVLGVLSLVLCNVLGPVAWVMGNEELRRLDAGQVDPMSRNGATAGRILGIISTVLMILGVVAGIAVAVLISTVEHHPY